MLTVHDLPAHPDDSETVLGFVSWAGDASAELGLSPDMAANSPGVRRRRDDHRALAVVDQMVDGRSVLDTPEARAEHALWPVTFLAAVDAGTDDPVGPLASWVAAMRTVSSQPADHVASRDARRAADADGPAALAEARELWQLLHANLRQLAVATPTPNTATAAPERSVSWR